jgi:cytochrome c6
MEWKFFLIFSLFSFSPYAPYEIEKGEILFLKNCSVCHPGGKNIILPEKSLNKENLEANGMNSIKAILYQVRNGKNGMPAFGDRLKEKQIEFLAEYILFQSKKNFEN